LIEIEIVKMLTWDQLATTIDWQQVDLVLRGIAKRRAALDADEARWLREAERLKIWRPLGMVSAFVDFDVDPPEHAHDQ